MKKKIENILTIWHEHFSDEENQYSEFEHSDIEYFVGCLLYNHLNFEYALDTMKTIDLSYDFIENCSSEYDDILKTIKTVDINDEKQKIEFLITYIKDAKEKYSVDELYLINRLSYHINGIAQRYENGEKAKSVDFVAPPKKSSNPLDRI